MILALAGGGCVAVAGGAKEGVVGAALGPPISAGYGRGDIAGSVVVERPAARVPVAFETVALYRRGELLTQASTDAEGRFRFLGLWFFGQFLLPSGSGVAWMAHVGGFLAGLGSVRLLARTRPRPPSKGEVQVEYLPPPGKRF